jgi:hypothetical protein
MQAAALAAGLARELERGRVGLQALPELAAQRRVRGHETAPIEVAVQALGAARLARIEHRRIGRQLVERAEDDVELGQRGHTDHALR